MFYVYEKTECNITPDLPGVLYLKFSYSREQDSMVVLKILVEASEPPVDVETMASNPTQHRTKDRTE